jgi:hypothetical protein
MNDLHHTPWSRLAAAARRAPRDESSFDADLSAPVGFSTRVVALAGLRPAAGLFGGLAFERLAARALAFSCACALAVTVWASMPATAEASPSADTAAVGDAYLDPVGVLLEVVQS